MNNSKTNSKNKIERLLLVEGLIEKMLADGRLIEVDGGLYVVENQ